MDTVSPHALGLNAANLALFTGAPDHGSSSRAPIARRILRFTMRWRWVLAGCVAGGALLGLVVTLLMTPQYSSTARLEISRDSDHVVNIDSVQRDTNIGDQEFYQTQYGLLQTKALSERVVRDLGLADDPAFLRMFNRGRSLEGDGNERVEAAGRLLLLHVTVAPVRGSRLVDVTATTPDAALSQRIAQSWSDNFIQSAIDRRFNASSYARHFLEQRLSELRDKLEHSERQAVGYAAEQGIISLPSPASSADAAAASAPDRSLVTDDLSTLNSSLDAATADRIAAQSRLLQASRPDATNEALSNNAITAMRQKRAELAADYAKMMIQFEPGYPPAKAAAAQIQALDTAIAREEGRVRSTLQQEYGSALARENALRARVGSLKQDLTSLRRRSIQYNIYQRDADTNRQLYNALLQRYKEIGVAAGVEKNNVSVVDPPQVPDRPSSPNLLIDLLLSTFAGALGGLAVAGILAQIDERVADPAEIEEKLGVPMLGTVPRISPGDLTEALQEPRSQIVEAYLAVQANLELSTAHGTPRSLAVTSSRPREGKSTTAVALAQSLARARRKVVLVDADMRSPSVHARFGLSNATGVSNFLAGLDDLAAVIQPTCREGLSVLTAGPQPPNAADLLTGDRMSKLIDRLQEQFDHVVVDCPPVLGLADAPLVSSAVEGVVYVVEAGSLQARMVRLALGRMNAAQVHMMGVVLTKLDKHRAQIGYGYDYGYGYGA